VLTGQHGHLLLGVPAAGNRGLGFEVARSLVARGRPIIIAVRDEAAGAWASRRRPCRHTSCGLPALSAAGPLRPLL
jgi:NAD(P)-dependent dehydrogenase (short-subunit alcohol dehydrogenase family)